MEKRRHRTLLYGKKNETRAEGTGLSQLAEPPCFGGESSREFPRQELTAIKRNKSLTYLRSQAQMKFHPLKVIAGIRLFPEAPEQQTFSCATQALRRLCLQSVHKLWLFIVSNLLQFSPK